MQQHDHRPIGRAFIDDIEHKATAAVLIHALSMDPPLRGVSHFTDFAGLSRPNGLDVGHTTGAASGPQAKSQAHQPISGVSAGVGELRARRPATLAA